MGRTMMSGQPRSAGGDSGRRLPCHTRTPAYRDCLASIGPSRLPLVVESMDTAPPQWMVCSRNPYLGTLAVPGSLQLVNNYSGYRKVRGEGASPLNGSFPKAARANQPRPLGHPWMFPDQASAYAGGHVRVEVTKRSLFSRAGGATGTSWHKAKANSPLSTCLPLAPRLPTDTSKHDGPRHNRNGLSTLACGHAR